MAGKQNTVVESNILDDSALISGNPSPLCPENICIHTPGCTNLIPMGEMAEYYTQLWSDKQNLQGLNARLTHLLAWNRELQEDNDRLQGTVEEWESKYDSLLKKIQAFGGSNGDGEDIGGSNSVDGADGGGSVTRGGRSKEPDSGVVLRLEQQLDQLRGQLQQRDQRLADQTAKNNKQRKDLQNQLSDAKRQFADKEKEIADKLADKDNELEQLKHTVQKQGDFANDRDSWKNRAEAAERELRDVRKVKTSTEKDNTELVKELRDQLKKAKLSEATRIEELNRQYTIRWEDLSMKMKLQVDGYKKFLENNVKKEHARMMKELEGEKNDLQKQLDSTKKNGLKNNVDLAKYQSRLQNMEFALRQSEQAKEKAEDELLTVKADLTEQLNDAKYKLGVLQDRYKELQQETAMLRQKIEVQPEVENYEEIISEWERSWDLTRPGKKRKRESILDSGMRGVNIFRSTRPSDSPIPQSKGGSFVMSNQTAFKIDGFANHTKGGPWLKIKNFTGEEQNLKDYSLKIESQSLTNPRKYVFDSMPIPANNCIRVITQETRPKLENDVCWNEGWETMDEEMDVSLISPEGKLVGGPVPLDFPPKNAQTNQNCQIM